MESAAGSRPASEVQDGSLLLEQGGAFPAEDDGRQLLGERDVLLRAQVADGAHDLLDQA